jgi:2-polyprenyl-6-methoxyphenol hydroxylase-like FAD-dependent oxidoreductase
MADVLVLGAGLNGLVTALLLARDGHRVTVLERDSAEPVGDAEQLWRDWDRPGVNQFKQLHIMNVRWVAELTHEIPEVISEAVALGAHLLSPLDQLPARITGGSRDGDARLRALAARRPIVEAALTRVAARTPGLVVRRGVTVTGLATGPSALDGVRHVQGVVSATGDTVPADLVVDVMGRRSPLSAMLRAIGAPAPAEEREDQGFVYYCRYFRTRDGGPPTVLQGLYDYDSISLLNLPCDADVWGEAILSTSRDKPLRALRDPDTWDRVRALLSDTEARAGRKPFGDVEVLAGLEDRHRSFVVNGQPVATGIVAVGDAWACTNPSLGRGAAIGAVHARDLRDLLRTVSTEEPEKLVRQFHEVTQAGVGKLYRATLAYDRNRIAEIQANIAGRPYLTDDPDWHRTLMLRAGARQDGDLLRALLAVAGLLDPPEVALAAPGLREKLQRVTAGLPRYPDGPNRAELLAAVSASSAG